VWQTRHLPNHKCQCECSFSLKRKVASNRGAKDSAAFIDLAIWFYASSVSRQSLTRESEKISVHLENTSECQDLHESYWLINGAQVPDLGRLCGRRKSARNSLPLRHDLCSRAAEATVRITACKPPCVSKGFFSLPFAQNDHSLTAALVVLRRAWATALQLMKPPRLYIVSKPALHSHFDPDETAAS